MPEPKFDGKAEPKSEKTDTSRERTTDWAHVPLEWRIVSWNERFPVDYIHQLDSPFKGNVNFDSGDDPFKAFALMPVDSHWGQKTTLKHLEAVFGVGLGASNVALPTSSNYEKFRGWEQNLDLKFKNLLPAKMLKYVQEGKWE